MPFTFATLALMLAPSVSAAQDLGVGPVACLAGDFAAALREWQPRAEQGDSEAQASLRFMYSHGDVVPQNNFPART